MGRYNCVLNVCKILWRVDLRVFGYVRGREHVKTVVGDIILPKPILFRLIYVHMYMHV